MKKDGKPDAVISTLEAAAMLGCSDDTALRLAHAGQLHGWRLTPRGRLKIERASVVAFIERRRRQNFHAGRKVR